MKIHEFERYLIGERGKVDGRCIGNSKLPEKSFEEFFFFFLVLLQKVVRKTASHESWDLGS